MARGAGDVLMEPSIEERMADRHAGRIWRGGKTTRREQNVRHPHW